MDHGHGARNHGLPADDEVAAVAGEHAVLVGDVLVREVVGVPGRADAAAAGRAILALKGDLAARQKNSESEEAYARGLYRQRSIDIFFFRISMSFKMHPILYSLASSFRHRRY